MITDQLADFPLVEDVKAEDYFPDEHIYNIQPSSVWNLFFDGSKNMAGIGIRILLIIPEREMIPYSLKLDFQCTHNMAEYEALIQGMKILQNLNVKRVHAFGDSLLIVSQVKVEWQVKDQKLIPYQNIVLALIDNFEEFQLNHIKREYNQIADDLASLGSILSFKNGESYRSFKIGRLDQPAFIPAI
jgi:ribonuclease HI